VQFNPTIESTNLKLNGAGIRYKFFFKIYAAALYVESTSDDANKVLNQKGSNRLIMQMIYDEVEKEKMVNSMVEGFEGNLSSENYKLLQPRINDLLAQYQGVKKGDVLVFDYTPNKGTTFSINGNNKVTIQGADFNQALLSIWIGEEPATDSLKNDLLGIQESSFY